MNKLEVLEINKPGCSDFFEIERRERQEIKHAIKACHDRRAQGVISRRQLGQETWMVLANYIKDHILHPEDLERFEFYPGVTIDVSGHVDFPDGRYLQQHYSSDDGHSYNLLHAPSFSRKNIINRIMAHRRTNEWTI